MSDVREYALHDLDCVHVSCSVTSEVLAEVGWELPTPPLGFFFFLKPPSVARSFLLTMRGLTSHWTTLALWGRSSTGSKKGGKNLTAQKSCVVTDVQSSELFQCAFHRDTEMGTA